MPTFRRDDWMVAGRRVGLRIEEACCAVCGEESESVKVRPK